MSEIERLIEKLLAEYSTEKEKLKSLIAKELAEYSIEQLASLLAFIELKRIEQVYEEFPPQEFPSVEEMKNWKMFKDRKENNSEVENE
jgi:hypothetical protein